MSKKPQRCLRCKGRGIVLFRQLDLFGGETTTSEQCKLCGGEVFMEQLDLFEGARGDLESEAAE